MWGGGGGGSLPMVAVPDAQGKGYPNQGLARNARYAKRVSKSQTFGERVSIQIAIHDHIRVV